MASLLTMSIPASQGNSTGTEQKQTKNLGNSRTQKAPESRGLPEDDKTSTSTLHQIWGHVTTSWACIWLFI